MSTTLIPNLFSVDGKVIVVTGGGSGIGNMIANAYAENGAKVYIVGRRLERLQQAVAEYEAKGFKSSGKLIALQGDVSHKTTIEKLIADFGKQEKLLHVLVNNAGIARKDPIQVHPDDVENLMPALWSSEWEGWQATMDTNVTALYFTSVGFAPFLREAFLANPSSDVSPLETPTVINISSIGGIHNGRMTSHTSYQAAKAAVHFLTKVLATRFTPLRVRVNCIAPGLFPTELTATDLKELRRVQFDQFKAMPEHRAGSPADIAGPAIFLASRAGAYLNGTVLDVGGGRTLMIAGTCVTGMGEEMPPKEE